MIPHLKLKVERQSWQQILSASFQRIDDLLAYLEIDSHQIETLNCAPFPLRVPKPFVDKMKKGDIHDPLLTQVLPLQEESNLTTGFTHDPLQEKQANPQPGLLQKFKSRVLLITSESCSVHCRYCFRRHFPYQENRINRQQWQACFDSIARDTTLREVILSGGDPLNLSDRHLAWFLESLDAIPHINTIRLHTRTPVMIPNRLTEQLLDKVSALRSQCVIVFHINHPNEICDEFKNYLAPFRTCGITLLNQSVLLKGVNDHSSTLIKLSNDLFQAGILPYYLHLLDQVQGSHHFLVESHHIPVLVQSLYEHLPGYLVPRVVQERPGFAYKCPYDLSFLTEN